MADNVILIAVQADDQASGPLNQIATGALRSIGAAAVEMAGNAAQAIAGLGAQSIQLAGDFEAGMNAFQVAAGDSLAAAGLSVDDFKNKFLEIGAELPVSTSAVQEAAITLVKGGIDPLVVKMGALESSIKFAAAAGMDLGAAAELSIKQLGTFVPITATAAEQTQFLAAAQDMLVKAAGASTLDVDKLGDAMLAAGGQAKASGVDYQDFVTTMGLISPAFGKAAEAGTSYKNFLARLQPTTKSATEAFQNLSLMFTNTNEIAEFLSKQGIQPLGNDLDTLGNQFTEFATAQGWTAKETAKVWDSFSQSKFFDMDGQFVGNAQAAELLQNALHGLSDAERSAALQAMFGNDAMGAAAALASNGAEGYEKFADAMAKATGVQATAATMQQGFNTALDNFHGSIESLQITIGSAVIPILTQLFNNTISPAINTLTAFAAAITSATDPWQFLLDTLNGVLPGLGTLVGFIADNLTPILAGIGAVITAVVVPAFWAWAFAAETGAVATAMAMLPVIAPIVAIGAAVALLVAAWQNNWFGIQEATAAVWAWLQPILAQLVAWVGAQLPVAIAAASALWTGTLWPALQVVGGFIAGTLWPILQQLGMWLATNIPIAVAAAAAALGTIVGTIISVATAIQSGFATAVTFLQTTWSTIAATASAAWLTVTTAVSSALSTIGAVIQTGLSIVTTILQAAWNTAVFLTSAAWNALVQAVSPAVQAVAQVIGPPIQAAVAGLIGAWNSASAAAASVWASITSAVSSAAAAIGSVLASIGTAAAEVWSSISAAASSAWASITSTISGAVSGVLAVITGAWSSAEGQTSGVWTRIKAIVATAIEGVKTAIATGVTIAKTIVTTAWAVIVAASQNNFDRIPQIIAGAWEKIKSAFSAGVAAVKGIFGEVVAAAVSLGADIVAGVVRGLASAGSAIADKLRSMATGALDAAKKALGIASPSKVAAATIGAPIVDGVIAGIVGRSPKAAEAMLDLAGKLFDVVSKGVGAFAELRQLGSVPMSAITQFADAIQFTLEDFARRVGIWDRAAMSAASQFTAKAGAVVEFLTKGLDLLAGISNLTAPSSTAISQFADALSWTMTEIVRISTYELRLGLMAGVEFASGAGQIVGVISKGVEALNSLADFVRPAPGVITTFANVLGWLVSRIVLVAQWIGSEGIGAAAAFADGAGKVLALVSTGVDAFLKLGEFVKPPAGVTQQFANMVGWLVSRIVEVANWIGVRGTAAAAAFADGAGKVLALVAAGVDAFTKLGEFVRPPAGITQQFANMVGWLVSRIVEVANWIGQRATAAAATFADGAGKVFALVATGVDAMTKLAGFVAPAWAAIEQFQTGLMQVVGMFILTARWFEGVSLDAAVAFAEAAGKILGPVGSGVESLSKLADFVAPAWAAIEQFQTGLMQVVGMFILTARWFEGVSLDAAVAFAEAAGKVVGVLGAGVDGLSKLADLQPVAAGAIQLFVSLVNTLVTDIAAASESFSADALAQAQKFAQSAGTAVGILKDGVEGLLEVDTFAGVSEAAISRFADGVRLAVAAMARLATEFGPEATAAAKAFAQAAGESTDFLKKGADGLKKVGEFQAVPVDGLKIFADGIKQMVNMVLDLSTTITTQMLADAVRFAIGIDQVIQVVGGGLKAFKDLAIAAANVQSFLATFGNAVKTLITDFKSATIPAATELGTTISATIGAGLTAGSAQVVAGLARIVQAISAWVGANAPILASAGLTLGQQIGIGLANGLVSTIPWIVQAAQAAAAAAILAAQQTLGIASPSKVFDKIGSFAGQGLAGGMDAEQANVAGAGAGLARSATLGTVSSLPTPSPTAPTTSMSNRSVTLQVAPGAIVVHGAPGQSEQQIATSALDRLQQLARMAATS